MPPFPQHSEPDAAAWTDRIPVIAGTLTPEESAMGRGKIGILFALEEEKRGLERVFLESRVPGYSDDGITTYFTRGAEVLLLVGGVGRERAARGANRLLDAGADLMVCAGFAAALDPCAAVGDVLVGNNVFLCGVDADPVRCSPSIRALLPPSRTLGFPIRLCNLATGDGIVFSPKERGEILDATGAAVYDMESYAAAQVCLDRGIPFAAIRGVSDTATQRVPQVVEDLIQAKNGLTRAFFIARRPRAWFSLLKLRRQASIATEHLGDVLGTMLLRIP
jgi:adenosylhomocysteine nucleosidase